MESIKQLRPHHLLCERFLELDLLDRGPAFRQMIATVRQRLLSDSDAPIEIIEGIDELCRACPDCRGSRCESPQGNEEAVRKFDRVILQGLGFSYGDKKRPGEIDRRIRQKAPLEICRTRCPWRERCTVFSLEVK